ncbi:MAG: signal peptidase II [Chthoniobacterales bacterium]|jgi:signal peptidase II|nr:signal peptidase II [Chthoniobacterales bacterium]
MKRFSPWGVILILAMLDQFTKILVLRFIPFQESIPVIPNFFSLTHVYNTGAAFGMLHDSNLFFVLLATLAFVALIVMRKHFQGGLMQTGWILLLAGIIGNVTDRLRLGHVVDFLDFQFGSYHWPSFNVADSCICIAATLFLLSSFQSPSKLAL